MVTTAPGTMRVFEPGSQFGRRYTIVRLLGSGGMATVYQARDNVLDTDVALKLIRVDPGTSAVDLSQLEDRFKRELMLARQVTHPNVVRIHDIGEIDGALYLTMAFVDGVNLATLLHDEPRLSIPRAVALATQIASGLAAAHRAGVVHRDLKPANVMVDSQGDALLMDFGIARSTSSATQHTVPGAVIGTLDYMAPEQVRGEPADERTDVYAFGLILYELLAGVRPRFGGQGGLSDVLARLEHGAPAISSVFPDVPPALERIVNTCLSPRPENRYRSASELLADLEACDEHQRSAVSGRTRLSWRLAASVLLGGAVLVAGTWLLSSTRPPAQPPAARAPLPVLIVDFENRAGERVFEGGLEQALSIAMEGAPFITAFPRRDAADLVRELKLGSGLDERAGRLLATREGIAVILAGTIDRRRDGYGLAVRAVSADRPEPLTVAEATAPDKAQVLGTIVRIAEKLRAALGDTDAQDGGKAETFTAGSLEAVRAYTVAQDLAIRQKDVEALAQYREALRLDPEFGRAYSGLAFSLLRLGRREESLKAWNEALRRIDRMTEREKLRTFGSYYLGLAGNYEKAIETFEELVAKFPADSAGYNNLAIAYFNLLNFGKAFEYGRKAIAIYPKVYKYRSNYALYAMYSGDFTAAATTARRLVEEAPDVDIPYLPLAMEALSAGDPSRARTIYQQAARAGEPGASLSAIGLADVAMYEGRYADAIAVLGPAARRDEEQANTLGASAKLVALAEAHAARREPALRDAAMARARKISDQESVLVAAARLALAAGRIEDARAIAAELAGRLPARSRAFAKLIEAEIAMSRRQFPEAIDALRAAQKLADLWLVRFALGTAYFERGAYPEALSEFEKCLARRGEATAVFLDDLPTFRHYVPTLYWLGRAREMQKLDARPQFQEFLRIRQGATGDPLVDDARRRIEAAGT